MIQYRYENDLLVDVIHMDQGVTHYEYDEHGYLTRAIDQAGVAYLTNKYDKKGRVVLQTLANGDHYQAQYVEEECKTIVYTNIGDKTTVYEYGKEQQELQDKSSNQEFSLLDTRIYYQYDAMNRLLEESYYENGVEETIQYKYDFCGNRFSKK